MDDMMTGTSAGESAEQKTSIRQEWIPMAILAAIWLAAIFLVNPRGDFPILDDWSYGRSVKTLLEEGRLQFDGWSTPTLVMQILYGALFCLPFGFSFETLRIAGLVAGLAGGLGTYILLREASARRSTAVVGSLTVMLNPAYLQLSFTFMTDTPFAAMAVMSAVFFLRALRGGAARDAAIGTILAVGATLIRDIGIALPLGYGVAVLVTTRLQQHVLLRSGLPLGFTVGALLLYNGSIDYLGMTPALKEAVRDAILLRVRTEGIASLLWNAFQMAEALFAHLALFMFPLVLILLGSSPFVQQLSSRFRRSLIFAFPLLLLILCWRFWPPDLPVRIFTIAHPTMQGPEPWMGGDEPRVFRQMIWLTEYLATALLIVFLGAIAVNSLSGTARRTHRPDAAAVLFGFTTSVGLVAPFVLGGHFMERYLIPALPLAAATLVALSGPGGYRPVAAIWKAGTSAGAVVLGLYGLVAILYAHDNLLWNRLAWNAIRFLVVERGIDPARIDGGLSGNGWFLFPKEGALRQRYATWRFQPPGWWRNENAEYSVAFSRDRNALPASDFSAEPLPGERFRIVWGARIDGWLPGDSGAIVVQRDARFRAEPAAGGK